MQLHYGKYSTEGFWSLAYSKSGFLGLTVYLIQPLASPHNLRRCNATIKRSSSALNVEFGNIKNTPIQEFSLILPPLSNVID